LQPFKRSAFSEVVKQELPILPCRIVGSDRVIPAKSMMIRPGRVVVSVGTVVVTEGRDVATVMEKTRGAIQS